jgi:hypothetical protein
MRNRVHKITFYAVKLLQVGDILHGHHRAHLCDRSHLRVKNPAVIQCDFGPAGMGSGIF